MAETPQNQGGTPPPGDGPGTPPARESRRARRKREREDETIQEEEAFYREVQEELRAERTWNILRKYGSWMVVAGALLIAAVAGWQYWESRVAEEQAESGRQYSNAVSLLQEGKTKEAIAAFRLVGREGSAGYAAMAQLRAGALLAQQGDTKGAVEVYRQLSGNEDAPEDMRRIATLMWAFHGLDAGAQPAAMIDRLRPLAAPDQPWRYMAAELTGYYQEKAGNKAAARETFTRLAADKSAPSAMRSRARDMLTLLGKS